MAVMSRARMMYSLSNEHRLPVNLRGPGPPHAAVGSSLVSASAQERTAPHFETDDQRVAAAPTPEERIRLSERTPWDESTRPHRDRSGLEVTPTEEGHRDGK